MFRKRTVAVVVSLSVITAGAVLLWASKLTTATSSSSSQPAQAQIKNQGLVVYGDFKKSEQTSQRSSDLYARFPENNSLAKSHYELDAIGNVLLPNDREMQFIKTFVFPKNGPIEISFSVEKRFDFDLPEPLNDKKSPDFFEPLKNAATSGNEQAGVIAFIEVMRCADLKPLSSRKQPGERCSKVTDDVVEESERLLREIADSGNAAAQDLYARYLMDDQPVKARKYFQALWQAGYSWGLGGLRQTAPKLAELDFDGQVEWEAYAYASFAISMAYLDGVPSDAVKQHVDEKFFEQQQRLLSLSPAVHAAAEERATAGESVLLPFICLQSDVCRQ